MNEEINKEIKNENFLGFGLCSINYPTIEIQNPDDGEYYPTMNPDIEPTIQKIAAEAQKIIGELILKSGDIEDLLWVEILRFFRSSNDKQKLLSCISQTSKKLSKRLEQFNPCSANADSHYSFSEKKDLLKAIMDICNEEYPLISTIEKNELDNEIEEAILFRNALAHGQMTIDSIICSQDY